MKRILRILPWCFLALFTIEMVVVMLPKKNREMHLAEFGRLPALLSGRVQPLDSVGRNSLLQLRSTGDLPLEFLPSWQFWRHPKKLRSTEWLAEVFFKPEVADTRAVFMIHHPDLLSELKLGNRGLEKSGLHYYTYQELESVRDEIMMQAMRASEVKDEALRTTYQKQVLKLANALNIYERLKSSVQPEGTENFSQLLADYKAALPAGVAAIRAERAGEKHDEAAAEKFVGLARQFERAANKSYPRVIPPLEPATDRDGWSNAGASLLNSVRTMEVPLAAEFYGRMAVSYARADAEEFNSAVAGYKNWLAKDFAGEAKKGRAEYYFNQVKFFLHATIMYIFALVLAGGALLTFGSWPGVSESLRRSAAWVIGLAFIIHTTGLIFRMALEGRPPVTNLYSSAIFIGWGACILGMILERIYRVGLGSAVAAVAGFITLLIAHNLALDGDTMEMMRAVLDTNFWLATHVVIITLGYASTFVAGLLGIAYVVLGVFTPLLVHGIGAGETQPRKSEGPRLGSALTKMAYGIICFATLFSFIGTVLGGIWADQSWGRFWGWDPKENGALLIVIWNALILHARWGGLVKERGLMNLAIFGNVVTAWSWFGTNMLGIGLHSYGFMDAAFKYLMLFMGSQVGLIVLGSIPLTLWKSFQGRTSAPAPQPA